MKFLRVSNVYVREISLSGRVLELWFSGIGFQSWHDATSSIQEHGWYSKWLLLSNHWAALSMVLIVPSALHSACDMVVSLA